MVKVNWGEGRAREAARFVDDGGITMSAVAGRPPVLTAIWPRGCRVVKRGAPAAAEPLLRAHVVVPNG